MASVPEVIEVAEEEETIHGQDEEGVLEDDDPEDEHRSTASRMCALMSDAVFRGFESHIAELQEARKRRQEALAFKSAVEEGGAAGEDEGGADQTQDELDGMGVRLPIDQWQGDANMRTLQKLLSRVDARGFERCAHVNPFAL